MTGEAVTVPIAIADRAKSGYAFVRDPAGLAKVTMTLVYEKKIEAPAVVLVTDAKLLIIGVNSLIGTTVENYESHLREIIAKEKAWAAIQAVHAVLKDGDAPIMHLRAEVNDLPGWQSYGVVIYGFGRKPDGGVAVMAHPERDYSLGTPYLLRPRLVIPPVGEAPIA